VPCVIMGFGRWTFSKGSKCYARSPPAARRWRSSTAAASGRRAILWRYRRCTVFQEADAGWRGLGTIPASGSSCDPCALRRRGGLSVIRRHEAQGLYLRRDLRGGRRRRGPILERPARRRARWGPAWSPPKAPAPAGISTASDRNARWLKRPRSSWPTAAAAV
jgi:hypothetical protein